MDQIMQNFVLILILLHQHTLKINTSFPWKQFFHDVNANVTIEEIDVGEMLCERNSTSLTCKCDEECFDRRDCCIDQFWNRFQSQDLNVYIKTFIEKGQVDVNIHEKMHLVTILPINFLKRHNISSQNVEIAAMVNTCDSKYKTSLNSRMCNASNYVYTPIIPVIDKYGVIYRSYYCAVCHDIHEYQYLNFTVECIQWSGITDLTVALTAFG